ncbi:hypothetical protein PRZ48_002789 [Zasmidium cellare]|uniref:Uncharacterized protein n=1 Tax=Zasmidium cellare TaxID=395010 RepID=A0ABR0ET81_ZASCE|nr:hypothetical protein PRZ48_002789 [Zasmidium cellare]
MAPSIIYFVKEGSRIKLANGKFTKAKTSYLHVGYVKRNYEHVYYEPADDEASGPFMPANFVWEGGSKRKTDRVPPKEGEIAWLIHFDPKLIQNSNRKERDDMHKQTLFKAWSYLAEDDPEELDEMEAKFKEPHDRLWHSWFEEAMAWKDVKMRRRTRRVAALIEAGETPEQAAKNANSDTDDSAVDVDDDGDDRDNNRVPMGPPPARRSTQRSSRRGPGSSRPGSDRPSKRARYDSPLSYGSSGGNSNKSNLGRLRTGPPRKARGHPSGFSGPALPFTHELSEDDSDDNHMRGGNNGIPRGAFYRSFGPRGAGSIENSPSVIDGSGRTPAMSVDYDPRPPETGTPHMRPGEGEWVADVEEWQNGDDEDAAYAEAVRLSSVAPEGPSENTAAPATMAPAQPVGDPADGEFPGLVEAMRASAAHEVPPPEIPPPEVPTPEVPPPAIQPTVEDVDGEE